MISDFAGSGAEPFRAALRGLEARFAGRSVGRILAVDPGVITGVSALYFSLKPGDKYKPIGWAETLITHDEVQQVWDLLSFLKEMHGGATDLIIEDFRVGRVAMEKSFLSPVRIGRRFEWGVISGEWFYRVRVFFHFNTDMSTWDDTRLKHVGFYTPGPDHRRDATRHVLQHHRQIRTGKIPSWEIGSDTEPWNPPAQKPWKGVSLSPVGSSAAGTQKPSAGLKIVRRGRKLRKTHS